MNQGRLTLLADDVWRQVIDAAHRAPIIVRVESAFPRAVNLGRIGNCGRPGSQFTLLPRSGRQAPGTLLGGHTDFSGVMRDATVEITPEVVRIPSARLEIPLAGVAYFSSRLVPDPPQAERGAGGGPWLPRSSALSGASTSDVAAVLAKVARSGSFVSAKGDPPFIRATAQYLALARSRFSAALGRELRRGSRSSAATQGTADAARPEPQLRTAMTGLLGLGTGLTPSGDDYLVGVLARLAADPSPAAARLATVIAAVLHDTLGAQGRSPQLQVTTAVSAHFLLAAAAAEFHQDLAAASQALVRGDSDPSGVFAAAAAIGSTSGTDALYGLVDAHTVLTASPPSPDPHPEHRTGRSTRKDLP